MGNVEDNIRYNSNATQAEIDSATEISHAKKFIDEWEEGTIFNI